MLSILRQGDPEISPEHFETIGRVMKARFGFALEGYKDKCVKRRISLRMRHNQCASAEEYTTLLIDNPSEQEKLLRVLTIHVSQFFRNPSTFEKIATDILPELLQRRGASGLSLLSVGCAAGEEPYTLALILRGRFGTALRSRSIDIVGTDIDAACLESARSGLYHPDRLAEVPEALKSRWFKAEAGQFRLSPEIRSLVSFDQRDLNGELDFGRRDLILCRNVLIYFERSRQEAILNAFADALKDGGYLVLGKSETLFGSVRRRFRTVCPSERLYRVTS
jgi:chemotaxis protein methyltransferase CheR